MGQIEIDHEYTDEIVCPYCGQEMTDSWEIENDDGTYDCECGKEFSYTRNVCVDYSTRKLPCVNGEEPHNWRSMATQIGDEYVLKNHYRCIGCDTEKVFKYETREEFQTSKRRLR